MRTLAVLAHRKSRVLKQCQHHAQTLMAHIHHQLQDPAGIAVICPWALSCLPSAVRGPSRSAASAQPMHLRHDCMGSAGFALSVAVPAQRRTGAYDRLTRSLANRTPDPPADAHEAHGQVGVISKCRHCCHQYKMPLAACEHDSQGYTCRSACQQYRKALTEISIAPTDLACLPSQDSKPCVQCGESYLLRFFRPAPTAPDGLHVACRGCWAQDNKRSAITTHVFQVVLALDVLPSVNLQPP